MKQELEDLVLYARELEKRPAGHLYEPGSSLMWGSKAWHAVPLARQMPAYACISELWVIAENLLAIDNGLIDRKGNEELSIQFYALYADMIWEFLRTHGIRREESRL